MVRNLITDLRYRGDGSENPCPSSKNDRAAASSGIDHDRPGDSTSPSPPCSTRRTGHPRSLLTSAWATAVPSTTALASKAIVDHESQFRAPKSITALYGSRGSFGVRMTTAYRRSDDTSSTKSVGPYRCRRMTHVTWIASTVLPPQEFAVPVDAPGRRSRKNPRLMIRRSSESDLTSASDSPTRVLPTGRPRTRRRERIVIVLD